MSEKNCGTCKHWQEQAKFGVGAIQCGGEFRPPDQRVGLCQKVPSNSPDKVNDVSKLAGDTCDDWEAKE